MSSQTLLGRLFVASRPLSWVNTAYPFAAAYLLAGGGIDAALVVGTIFFLIPYNLAMYGINDVFDYQSDAVNPRKGGVEGALLPPSVHRTVLVVATALCVPFVFALVLLGNPASWAVLAVSLFAVAAYSVRGLRFKEIPFLDSITSSTHFASPAVYGLVLAGAAWDRTAVLALSAFFLWGLASHAFGAVQDVVPDREGGIASIATVLGAATTVRLALALWLVAGVLLLFLPFPGWLTGLLALPYLALAWPYRSVSDAGSGRANRGWRRFLLVNYLVGFAVTSALVPFTWVTPDPKGLLLGLATGIFGTAAQYLTVAALHHERASVLAPLFYGSLVWSILFGYILFGDLPDLWTYAGAATIIAGGLYTLSRSPRRR
ncbi:MAG: prenyltransferase [Microbacterium sp.]|nr:prenyltransferase [Microbacterium sp.]